MIKKLRKMKKGFTLVELVIVIAIVIVLSVVSVPIYNNYVEKAMMTEGYALLGTILSAQKSYYAEYGNFLTDADSTGNTSYEPILGVDARGNKYFTFFFVGPGSSYGDPTYYFHASAWKPKDLGNTAEGYLRLQYNITLGAKIHDNPRDSSWWAL